MFLMGVNFSKYFDLLDTLSVKIGMCVLLCNAFFRCDLFWLQNQLNYEYILFENSEDPDLLASNEASWSGSSLFYMLPL